MHLVANICIDYDYESVHWKKSFQKATYSTVWDIDIELNFRPQQGGAQIIGRVSKLNATKPL